MRTKKAKESTLAYGKKEKCVPFRILGLFVPSRRVRLVNLKWRDPTSPSPGRSFHFSSRCRSRTLGTFRILHSFAVVAVIHGFLAATLAEERDDLSRGPGPVTLERTGGVRGVGGW